MIDNQRIKKGMELLSSGKIKEADQMFRKILQDKSDSAEALYGRACVALIAKAFPLAIGFAGQAVQIRAHSSYYTVLGMALYEQGHLQEAISALKSAVILNPSDARAYNGLAQIQIKTGLDKEAVGNLKKAIELQKNEFIYWNDLIRFYWDQQEYLTALQVAQKSVKENPGESEFLHKLANILQLLDLYDEAVIIYNKIIRLCPSESGAFANLGSVLFQMNRLDEAKIALQHASENQAYVVETQVNLALVEMACGDLISAQQRLEEAYCRFPYDLQIGLNLGTVYFEMNALDKAEVLYQSLLPMLHDKSVSETDLSKFYYNFSSVLLAKGAFRPGWEYMEARHVLIGSYMNHSDLPYWNGEDMEGQLLVRTEQGLGDILQFARFLPFVAKKCKLVLEVPVILSRLMHEIVKIQDISEKCQIIEKGQIIPVSVTCQCMIMSLPYLLKLENIPSDYSYSFEMDEKQARLKRITHKKSVGICWAGNAAYRFDRLRSVSLELLSSLCMMDQIEFYSLQAGIKEEELPNGVRHGLPDGDLLQTAFIIQQLDLVITVDTVIAHLAGLLGKPVWLLNRYGGDWRWQKGNQDDHGNSLWYPSIRIFKQQQDGISGYGWQATVEMVKKELIQFTKQ